MIAYTCEAGHHIVAAFAFCACDGAEHFLWGHACPVDGRYWAACPTSGRVASGDDWQGAALELGGTWR